MSESAPSFAEVFQRLRSILQEHATTLRVTEDTPRKYCLEGKVGPATLHAWGGQARRALIPVVWIEIVKTGVSYHLMPLGGGTRSSGEMSPALQARMQGNTCFTLRAVDEAVFAELAELTRRNVTGFTKAGFIVGP
jgi:hypothetical protein